MNKLLRVIAVFVCMCIGGLAVAQENVGRFSEGQRLLNQQAFEATSANDFKKAEGLYKSMLLLGEHNVTFLNLGRAYLKQGKCMEAASTLNKVEGAPQVEGVPMDGILSRLAEYREEMATICTARMVLDCTPAEMVVSIDSGDEFVCNTAPIPMSVGTHTFMARYQFPGNSSFDSAATTKEITGGDINTVHLVVENAAEKIRCGGMSYEEWESRSRLFKILGWTFLGVGVAGAGAAGGYVGYKYVELENNTKKHNQGPTDSYEKIKADQDNFKTAQIIGFSAIGVSAALAVTGITLLVFDAVSYSDDCQADVACKSRSTLEVYPLVGAGVDGGSIGLGMRF